VILRVSISFLKFLRTSFNDLVVELNWNKREVDKSLISKVKKFKKLILTLAHWLPD